MAVGSDAGTRSIYRQREPVSRYVDYNNKSLLTVKDDEMLNVRCARKKVIAFVCTNSIGCRKERDVAGLGSRVTAKINDSWWLCFE